MNLNNPDVWRELRTAYRPAAPELDTGAIMAAVRREAAARPLPRIGPGMVRALPTWACAAAAALALLATATVTVRAVRQADREISHAWLRSIQPGQFERALLGFDDSSL